MKCLITGGAGFIGSHLAQELLVRGNHVTVLDDLSTGRMENLAAIDGDRRFTMAAGDLLDIDLLDELVSGCDEVYHLAAVVGVKLILERPLDAMRVNMEGTAALLRAAAAHGRGVLVASSSEVYGHAACEPLAEENMRRYGSTSTFRWAYAGAKAMGESLALAYHREKGLHAVVARLFNVVGPRQSAYGGMVLPTFVKQALAGTPITVFGSGEQTRCFTHVSDVADAMIRLMRNGGSRGEIYNIGSSEKITITKLAERVKELCGSSSPIRFVPYGEAYPDGFEEIMQRVPDLEKIRSAIDYRPRFGLDAIINDVIEYARASASPVALPTM
jgi:UDP-glucose 4-epimerase